MSIKDIVDKSKRLGRALEQKEIFVALLFALVSFASFGLGRLSALQEKKTPIRIEQSAAIAAPAVLNSNAIMQEEQSIGKAILPGGSFVGSKSGTTYHFPWCSGALRIKNENKIWFQTKEAAEKAGYHPAGNCKGL